MDWITRVTIAGLVTSCAPSVDDSNDANTTGASESTSADSNPTSATTDAELGSSSDSEASEAAWELHCAQITTKEGCVDERSELPDGRSATCSWTQWAELLGEEKCELGQVLETSCHADFWNDGEESFAFECELPLDGVVCVRQSGESRILGYSSADCGMWSICPKDEDFCGCACQLGA